jgi:hypothetical protein
MRRRIRLLAALALVAALAACAPAQCRDDGERDGGIGGTGQCLQPEAVPG